MRKFTSSWLVLFCVASSPAQNGMLLVGTGGGGSSPVFSTLNVDLVYTGNFSTTSTPMTVAIANSSTVSNNCAVGSGSSTGCNWQTPDTGFTVGANQSACENLGAIAVNGGGPTYAADALAFHSIEFANNANSTFQFFFNFGTAPNAMTVGTCYYVPTGTFSGDVIDSLFVEDSVGGAAWVQTRNCADGNNGFYLETSIGGGGENNGAQCIEPGGTPFPGYYLISENFVETSGAGFYGTYSSGGTVTGTIGLYCNVTFASGGGGTGTIILQGTNSLTGAFVFGTPTTTWSAAPTSGTLSNGTGAQGAACSGTATFTSATLSGLITLSVHNATTGALIGQTAVAVPSNSDVNQWFIGNDENYAGSTNWYFQNLIATWTGTPPKDMYGAW